MKPRLKPNLDALTGIRFFAALHVVLFHFGTKTAGFESLPDWAQRFVWAGQSSVGLFFVLSGFILSYNYSGRRTSLSEFWAARFARIYPVYLFAFLLFAPFAYLKYHSTPLKLAAIGLLTATLMQAWTSMAINWNAPGWSLSAELFFYLLFPFVLPLTERLERSRALVWAGMIYCAALIAPLAYTAGYIDDPNWYGRFQYNPIIWLPAFVIGMLFERSGVRVSKAGGVLALAAILILLAVCPRQLQELLTHGALFPFYGILICSLKEWPGWFGASGVVLLGEASYSLYILHVPLWNVFIGSYTFLTTGNRTNSASHVSHLLLYLVVCIGISIASFRWIEQPARYWVKKLLTGRWAPVTKQADRAASAVSLL